MSSTAEKNEEKANITCQSCKKCRAIISKTTPDYKAINYEDVLNCKNITIDDMKKDFEKLVKLSVENNNNSFCGNKIIYALQLRNMLKVRRNTKNFETLEEIFEDDDKKKKLIDSAIKANRRKKLDYLEAVDIYELYRFHKGSVNTFKASAVKYLCKKYKATKYLDVCAGWGGRLLGARSLGIDYIGFDTNLNLKEGYDKMISLFGGEIVYKSCMDVDFSKIDYDFVLTSPPYCNVEIYEGSGMFEDWKDYYMNFLIPLIDRLKKHIRRNGKVCINISDYMYDNYLKYGGIKAEQIISLKQQTGGKKNKEMVYVF